MDNTSLYRVTQAGGVELLGRLVHGPGTYEHRLVPELDIPGWMMGLEGNGHFHDLPFFFEDLFPQGWLGTCVAQGAAKLQSWSTTRRLDFVTTEGFDLPGDLLVGERSREAFGCWRPEPISADPDALDEVAEQALDSCPFGIPGPLSLVGGAKPKFSAYVGGRWVIVKPTPLSNRRVCDLLRAEHLALDTLAAAGVAAAESHIHETEGYLHFETVRFDRAGTRGRLPVISLRAVDMEYAGVGHGWAATLNALRQEALVTDEAVATGRLLHWFGMLIENTDMHSGNLSLVPRGDGRFDLAPAYDMLPMRYVLFSGDLTNPPRLRIPARDDEDGQWERAVRLAHRFWTRVESEPRISADFRALAANRALALEQVMATDAEDNVFSPGEQG